MDGSDVFFLVDAPFNSPPNRLDDCETFVEFKTSASLAITPNARAQQVLADTEKRAHDLDLKYPGSTFTQVLKSHGKDGRYLVLVVALLPIFLTTSWSCVPFSDELVP